jgi:hypothetical protein
MSIDTYSWADLGYRQLAQLTTGGMGISPTQLADKLRQLGDYEVEPDGWIRRPGRKRNGHVEPAIEIIDTFDQERPCTADRLEFIDQHFSSEWERINIPRFTTETDVLEALVRQGAITAASARRAYRITQAMYLAGPKRLKPLFRDRVLPWFSQKCPDGRLVVLRYGDYVETVSAVMRILHAAVQLPHDKLSPESVSGIGPLKQWHMLSLAHLMPLFINFFNYVFYPFVGGFHSGPVGLAFVFLLEPAPEFTPNRFPRNWLAFPSSCASFGREDVDMYEAVGDFQGPAWKRASHQRFRHDKSFNAAERIVLFKWYIERVNRLLYELTDLSNFTERGDPLAAIDPVMCFEHGLTFDRLLRKTILAMSLDDAGSANLMSFEIADLYDTLYCRFTGAQETALFKRLFHPTEGRELVVSRLRRLPEPFATYFCDVATQVYAALEKTIVESIWLKDKITANGILVRNEDLTVESPMPVPTFVSEVMRCYRNAHHGYFSSAKRARNRTSRFLFLVDGNLPVEMSALPVLWFLAYLVDQSMVGWKQLPIHTFD